MEDRNELSFLISERKNWREGGGGGIKMGKERESEKWEIQGNVLRAPRATDGGETFDEGWMRQGEPFPALNFRRPSPFPSLLNLVVQSPPESPRTQNHAHDIEPITNEVLIG